MSTILDVIIYIFEWLRNTEFVPFVIGEYTFTFTILEILLLPFYVALAIFVIRHILELAN